LVKIAPLSELTTFKESCKFDKKQRSRSKDTACGVGSKFGYYRYHYQLKNVEPIRGKPYLLIYMSVFSQTHKSFGDYNA
jgi:hypothetical protein